MNWLIWGGATAVVAIIGIVFDAIRANKNKELNTNFFAVVGALGFGYLAYTLSQNIFIAVVAGCYELLLFGMRWPEWLSQDRKFGRWIFWLLADLPFVAIFFASWAFWQKGWITFALSLLGALIHFFMTEVVLKPVFPIIARQQAVVMARRNKNAKQIQQVEKEIKQLELNAHLRKMLAKVNQHQELLNQAMRLFQSQDVLRSVPLVQEIIADLSPLPVLDPRQKVLLGNALLLRGKVHAQLKQYEEAAKDFEKARQYVQLDHEAITGLAINAVLRNDTSEQGIRYCLDFLKSSKGQSDGSRVQHVRRFLEVICTIPPNLSESELRKKKDTLRMLVDAAPDMPAAWLAFGQVLVLLGETAEGIECLEKARTLLPENPVVYEFLGRGYDQLGRAPQARDAYEESLRLNPNQAKIAHALGLIYLDGRLKSSRQENHDDLALKWLSEAARLKPDSGLFIYNLARVYEKRGDLKRARVEVERSLALDGAYLPAHMLLGNLLFTSRDFPGALEHYRRVAEKGGWKDLDLRTNAGICMVELGLADEALELLSPLTTKKPDVLIYTGRAHLQRKEYSEAIGDIRQYIHAVESSEAAEYYLGCALAAGSLKSQHPKYVEAIECFESVIQRNGNLAVRAHLQLGKAFQLLEELEKAAPHYQASARQADTQLHAGLGLVRIYAVRDQLPEARAVLDFLVKKYADEKRIQALFGLVAEKQGDLEAAQEGYGRAGDIGSQGVMLFWQEKTQPAAELLEKARAAGDQSDRVLYYCGFGHALKNEIDGAIYEWTTLQARYPEDEALAMDLAQLWYLRGCKQLSTGKYSQAAEDWEKAYPKLQSDTLFMRGFQQVYMLAAFAELGKPDSFRLIDRARELGAEQQLCLFWQAVSHLVQGDLTSGSAEMKRYISGQPVDAQAQYNLGVALIKVGQGGDAAHALESASRLGKGTLRKRAAWALAAAKALDHDWKQVVELTAGIGTGEMQSWQALLVVAALVHSGELDKARALAAQNQSADAHALIGAAYTASMNISSALEEYHLALKLDSQQPAARQGAVAVLLSVAAEHAGNKEWKEAQACVQEAYTLAPADPAVLRLRDAVDGAAVLSGVSLENPSQAITILERLQSGDICRVDIAHQLAIMDHRRAIMLESSGQNGERDQMWLRAIANWGVVVAGDVYWERWLSGRQAVYVVPIPPVDVEKLRQEMLKNRIKEIHTQFIQIYTTNGQSTEAARHRRLSARLSLELSAARAMLDTMRMLGQKGKPLAVQVASGPQFWEQYGLTNRVSQMIDEALRIDPSFQAAQTLKEALQPTGLAKALLNEVQVDEAIALLREYLAKNPNDAPAKALIGKALITKLQAQVNTDLDGAFITLQEAKRYGADGEEAEKAIFSGVMNQVNQAENNGNPEKAEQVLRTAIKAMPQNRMLKDKLADLAGNRIVNIISKKLDALGQNLEPARVSPVLEEGKRLLREVDQVVGPNHPLIQKHLGELYSLSANMVIPGVNKALDQFNNNSIGIQSLLNAVNNAVSTLEEAARYATGDAHLQKNLTDLRQLRVNVLNSTAVDLANKAASEIQYNRYGAVEKLKQARDLLNQARNYDRYNAQVNENLTMVNQILNRMGYY